MKALIFKRYGGLDQVTFADIPRPVPKPDEILIQVHAAGLNPIDLAIPKGTFKPILRFQLPATLGSDLAGVVVKAGSHVIRFKPGDAVFACIFDLGSGALAEFAIVPQNAAALKPANLNFVQAARFQWSDLLRGKRSKSAQTFNWGKGVHPGWLWWDRHVRNPNREISRRKSGDDHQHGKC